MTLNQNYVNVKIFHIGICQHPFSNPSEASIGPRTYTSWHVLHSPASGRRAEKLRARRAEFHAAERSGAPVCPSAVFTSARPSLRRRRLVLTTLGAALTADGALQRHCLPLSSHAYFQAEK